MNVSARVGYQQAHLAKASMDEGERQTESSGVQLIHSTHLKRLCLSGTYLGSQTYSGGHAVAFKKRD